jgi:transcriptional regulator with XRE-family HTH domain
MPHRIGFNKNRRPHFFKQWRAKRGLSQERLAERLETSVASVSRVESGKQPYTQDYLEALAAALQVDPASLIMRDPDDPDMMWSIWENAKQGERKRILEAARTIVKKTGT